MPKSIQKLFYFSLIILGLATITIFFKDGVASIPSSIIFQIRFEKTLVLLIGSFAIGSATFMLQRLTKNNIVDITIFGITSMNVLFITLLYLILGSASADIVFVNKVVVPFASIGFSIFAVLLIVSFAMSKKGLNPKGIVLTGILFNYLFLAISYALISALEPAIADSILNIALGVINEIYSWWMILVLGLIVVGVMVWYMLIYRKIYVYNLENDISYKLGNQNRLITLQQVVIIGALSAVAFSCLGTIAFLGVISGNLALSFFKNGQGAAIYAGMISMIITTLAYVIFNSLLGTYFPIGVTTSIISIPYFIWKVVRSD